jgi:hypothetical protein
MTKGVGIVTGAIERIEGLGIFDDIAAAVAFDRIPDGRAGGIAAGFDLGY